MARDILNVILDIDRIIAHTEGDGWGSAEPYLWTVFFKIDGQTIAVGESLTLIGAPVVERTPGSHGNLGTNDVDSGDVIVVPPAIGEWTTALRAIPGPASLPGLEFAGVIGVVAVLMEEDNVSDAGAEAGHHALNNAVEQALQELVASLGAANQEVTKEQVDALKSGIEDKVRKAIIDHQNAFQNLWAWFNPDDSIGTQIWYWDHDELAEQGTIEFSQRWKHEGDWELQGHISATVMCPVQGSKDLIEKLGGAQGQGRSIDLTPMRQFRDGGYRTMQGLPRWFALAERHAPRLGYLMLRQPELRESVRAVLEWGNAIAREPNAKIDGAHYEHAARLCEALAKSNSRRARIDASRALEMLAVLEGRTHAEALRLLNEISPATHPTIGGNRIVRDRSRKQRP